MKINIFAGSKPKPSKGTLVKVDVGQKQHKEEGWLAKIQAAQEENVKIEVTSPTG